MPCRCVLCDVVVCCSVLQCVAVCCSVLQVQSLLHLRKESASLLVEQDALQAPHHIHPLSLAPTRILLLGNPAGVLCDVAVCCSVLQCVAACCVAVCRARCSPGPTAENYNTKWQVVCCCVLQCVAVCCNMLQRVAVCCSMLQRVAVFRARCFLGTLCGVAVCCSVLQHVASCLIFCCDEVCLSSMCVSSMYSHKELN